MRIIICIFISSLCIIPVTCIQSLIYLFENYNTVPNPKVLRFPDPKQPLQYVLLYSMYGVPSAFTSLTLLALPLYAVSKKILNNHLFLLIFPFLLPLPASYIFGGNYSFTSVYSFILPHAFVATIMLSYLVKKDLNQAIKQMGESPNVE